MVQMLCVADTTWVSPAWSRRWTFAPVKKTGDSGPERPFLSSLAYSGSSEPVGNGRTGSRGWSCWWIEEECGSF